MTSERDADVIVIGAGAAGLAAARALSAAGRRVLILEARDRIGGRLLTHREPSLSVPIELGAEFVHGAPAATLDIVRTHGLTTYEVAEQHHVAEHGEMHQLGGFWSRVERVIAQLDHGGNDRSVAAALVPHRRSKSAQWAARYVEGFHAADVTRMSARSLARSESGEVSGGSGAARILDGYAAFASALAEPLHGPKVDLRLQSVVTSIDWEPGHLTVCASAPAGAPLGPFTAAAAILTVPLGVLQATPGSVGAIKVSPEPPRWTAALGALEMGHVVHVTLRFREPPWPDDLGFLHVPGAIFPTWWTLAPLRAPVITAWAGGPSALRLQTLDRHELAATALDVLATALSVDRRRLGGLLIESHQHDWTGDPFSRGAYSYALVGGADAFSELGQPVGRTLVIAGEATAPDGENGTVQGALKSGERAARAVIGWL